MAWSILAVVQLILSYVFLSRIELFVKYQPRLVDVDAAPGLTAIVAAPLYSSAGLVLLLVAPMITMRTFSDEKRNGTLPLLLAAPLSSRDIVLGKFFGLFGFFIILAAMVTLMPLSLIAGGHIDPGQLASCFLGLVLLLGSFTAIGLYLSSLTSHSTVAGITTFGLLLLFWIIDWNGGTAGSGNENLLTYLSISSHFQRLLNGILDSTDIVYFLLLIAVPLTLATWRLHAER